MIELLISAAAAPVANLSVIGAGAVHGAAAEVLDALPAPFQEEAHLSKSVLGAATQSTRPTLTASKSGPTYAGFASSRPGFMPKYGKPHAPGGPA